MNTNKLMDKLFTRTSAVVFDMMTQKMGVVKDGSILSPDFTDKESPCISENIMIDMSMSMPAFAQATPLSQISVEDLILAQDKSVLGWVVKVHPKSLEVLKPTGQITKMNPSKIDLLGQGQTVMKVMSMVQNTGSANNTSLDPMMLMLMMKDSEGSDDMMKTFMLSQMMGGSGDNQQAMNPMMMMMMMKDSTTDSDSMMEKLLTMQMLQGQTGSDNQQSMNPMMMAMMLGKG